jgi:molybdate transport system substrate-binding protein
MRPFLILATVTLVLLAPASVVRAADVVVLCSNGFRTAMEDLVPRFETETGSTVTVTYGLSAELARRIEGGLRFDVAILTPMLIDGLTAAGKIASGSHSALARTPIGVAFRQGSPKPDLGNPDEVRRTMLAAKSVAYAREGASAAFFLALIQRLGLADALKDRIVAAASGAAVAASVAHGDVELGVLPVSEILPSAGVQVAGTFPADLAGYITLSAGLSAAGGGNAAAKSLVAFLTGPTALAVLPTRGMERSR